jgi:hypothetical protein
VAVAADKEALKRDRQRRHHHRLLLPGQRLRQCPVSRELKNRQLLDRLLMRNCLWLTNGNAKDKNVLPGKKK